LDERPEIVHSIKTTKWDLLIIDSWLTVSGIMFATMSLLNDTPYILYHTSYLVNIENIILNVPRLNSYLPGTLPHSSNYDSRKFSDRLLAFLNTLEYMYAQYKIDNQVVQPMYQKYGLGDRLSMDSFYQNGLMSLIEYPFYLHPPTPRVNNGFYIGGMCPNFGTEKTLDKEMIRFVEDPKSKGTIVIAFGHLIKWENAPDKVRFFSIINFLKPFELLDSLCRYSLEKNFAQSFHAF